MTTLQLATSQVDSFDYVIVGGGTAGCVIASRLAGYLPDRKILLIEAGPSDYDDDRVLNLREWLKLLGGELDYDYGTTEQPNGNSFIRHSRAKVLGGCSSHNTLISFKPFEYDCKVWEAKGCYGWSFQQFNRLIDQLRNQIQPVHPRHRNQICKDWIQSCSSALGIPIITDFNKEIASQGGLKQGVGFFSVAYNPEDSRRSSASVAYLHPIIRGEEKRPNLTILVEAWVSRVNVEEGVVTGVNVSLKNGEKLRVKANKEVVLSAGAVDTPRLLLLSGIGPRKQLLDLGIPVVKDVPGVGENLLDHPESIIIWELNKPIPQESTMDSDAGVFLRREVRDARGGDGEYADMMMHCYQIPFCLNTASRGRIYLTSSDPTVKPALDFRYFTDPEGYDATTIVEGLKAARKVALHEPFKSWLKREVAPGPNLQTDEELSEYGRRVAHTVYHPAGTTKMGDPRRDPMAVVDWRLRLAGLRGCRVADAGVFPEMPSINPMLTVLAIGERAAEMIAEDAGWKAKL
ncbi:hypothetical protein GP486_002229 [Trichoglossum hirsutum]|uniref:Glucose-methanol-choline oxidoreductase N-terminal domain-containing protein n=1 Tax=Trichoglossum hirsutum TaxID=265104 RepID=A0A9P8RS99_9PEZI|nr:hypothetical protein GP486_002229 [Trichoglossum hirsutum]